MLANTVLPSASQISGFIVGIALVIFGSFLGIQLLKDAAGDKLSRLYSAFIVAILEVGLVMIVLNSPLANWSKSGVVLASTSLLPVIVGLIWYLRLLEADMINGYPGLNKSKVASSLLTFGGGLVIMAFAISLQ